LNFQAFWLKNKKNVQHFKVPTSKKTKYTEILCENDIVT